MIAPWTSWRISPASATRGDAAAHLATLEGLQRPHLSTVPLLVVGLMVLALIPNAVAKKPFNANWTHRDVFYFGACDGFDIYEGVTIDVRYREYCDNDGNLNSVMF